MTKLEGMPNDQVINDRNDASSSFAGCVRAPRHSQLRKKKRVNVRRLPDALTQGGADAVTRARARPQ